MKIDGIKVSITITAVENCSNKDVEHFNLFFNTQGFFLV